MPHLPKMALIACLLPLLAACGFFGSRPDGPPARNVNVNRIPNARPVPIKRSPFGNPSSYKVNGRRYRVLPNASAYSKTGIASWYGTKFHGKLTSTREVYNMYGMTAASTELPLPTFVAVTNLENGKQVIVKVNDRGPFAQRRILDLSYVAAKKLGMLKKGTALVRVRAINPHDRNWRRYLKDAPIPARQPRIYLQLGAYSQKSSAIRLRNQLRANAIYAPASIETVDTARGKLHRLILGPIRTVQESDKLTDRLNGMGLTSNLQITS